MSATFSCPVCGWPGLKEPARSAATGAASFEICPSCGFEFGFDDEVEDWTYETWRARWVDGGMAWAGIEWAEQPLDWDPAAQLASLDA